MTWRPSHPGGLAVCDAEGCERERRIYCSPEVYEKWATVTVGRTVRDYCPTHKPSEREPVTRT